MEIELERKSRRRFSGRPEANNLGVYLSALVSAVGCFWMTRSIDEDGVMGNGGAAVVGGGGRGDANDGDEEEPTAETGGVDGGVLFLSNGLTRSSWAKFRLGSYLESASLKTTEELVYTEVASTAVVDDVVFPV